MPTGSDLCNTMYCAEKGGSFAVLCWFVAAELKEQDNEKVINITSMSDCFCTNNPIKKYKGNL